MVLKKSRKRSKKSRNVPLSLPVPQPPPPPPSGPYNMSNYQGFIRPEGDGFLSNFFKTFTV